MVTTGVIHPAGLICIVLFMTPAKTELPLIFAFVSSAGASLRIVKDVEVPFPPVTVNVIASTLKSLVGMVPVVEAP